MRPAESLSSRDGGAWLVAGCRESGEGSRQTIWWRALVARSNHGMKLEHRREVSQLGARTGTLHRRIASAAVP